VQRRAPGYRVARMRAADQDRHVRDATPLLAGGPSRPASPDSSTGTPMAVFSTEQYQSQKINPLDDGDLERDHDGEAPACVHWYCCGCTKVCRRFRQFLWDVFLLWLAYPACAIILFDYVFPEHHEPRRHYAQKLLWVWLLALCMVIGRLGLKHNDKNSELNDVVKLFFDGLMWTIQGSVAYGLVISHQLQNGQPQIGIVYLLNVTLGYRTDPTTEQDTCIAASEIFYPTAVFLFMGVLRSWEHAAYPIAQHKLHEDGNLMVYFYRWILVRSLMKKTLVNRLCCESLKTRAKEECKKVLDEINRATEELNFLNVVGSQDDDDERGSTDQHRLKELDFSFIEGFKYARHKSAKPGTGVFEGHRGAFAETFRSISPLNRTKDAIEKLNGQAVEQRLTADLRNTSDYMLGLTRDSSVSVREQKESELVEEQLVTQPVVYAMVGLRLNGTQRYDETGCKQGSVDEQPRPDQAACYMRASDIVRMIVLRSKADQIMLHRWSWWSVVVVSWLHAALPILRHLVEKTDTRRCGTNWDNRSWWNEKDTLISLALIAVGGVIGAGLMLQQKTQPLAATALGVVGTGSACVAVVLLTGIGTPDDWAADWIGFLINYWLTFSITIRLAKCFEDCYEKYRRMRFFLQLVPWPTMKRKHTIPTDGLLPTFELNSVTNIEAWNKMRIYLERYDLGSIQRRQVSVVWLLIVWLVSIFYQLLKFVDPAQSSIDTESVFQISNTFQLLIGLSLILYYGNRTNELQGLGLEHLLRVSQAALVSKSAHFLSEHEKIHGVRTLDEDQRQYVQLIDGGPTPMSGAVTNGAQAREPPSMMSWLRNNNLKASQQNDVSFAKRREFYLIEALVETVKNEHGPGDRTHWGAEDRRARLLCIYMDRSKLYTFWTSVLSALVPVLYHGIASLYDNTELKTVEDQVASMNASCYYKPDCLSAQLGVKILEHLKQPDAGT
jgi:hypothetical protein